MTDRFLNSFWENFVNPSVLEFKNTRKTLLLSWSKMNQQSNERVHQMCNTQNCRLRVPSSRSSNTETQTHSLEFQNFQSSIMEFHLSHKLESQMNTRMGMTEKHGEIQGRKLAHIFCFYSKNKFTQINDTVSSINSYYKRK